MLQVKTELDDLTNTEETIEPSSNWKVAKQQELIESYKWFGNSGIHRCLQISTRSSVVA